MPIRLIIFLCVACMSKTMAQAVDGLVGSFVFNNGSLSDGDGKHTAKAYSFSFTEDRFGNTDHAIYLNGSYGSFINLGSSRALKPEKGTVSIWFKVEHAMHNGQGTEINPIIWTRSHGGEDYNEAYYMGYDVNTKNIGICATVAEKEAVTMYSKKIMLRRWYHAVLTYDDNWLVLYLNGKLENKVPKHFRTTFLATDSILAGSRVNEKNIRFFNGVIDDIQLYNRVLSAEEVLNLYNAPNPNRNRILLGWLLLGIGLVLLILLSLWLIRRYIQLALKKEKEKFRLEVQWFEQENKVLKAQMNPHFIFNSLNTIQQFIIANDNKKAQLYLSKFSRLIRSLLESNTHDKISLKEEIELCEKYLEIESLRFNNVFSYHVIDTERNGHQTIFIPHFLIQPFIENAIWHGLLPKKNDDRRLTLSFTRFNEQSLAVTIDDNGIGRQKAKTTPGNETKKSLAISFIQQRLLLYSKVYGRPYSVTIIDKTDDRGNSAGTRIELTLPILTD